MKKENEVLKTIAEKSWDHGLNFELAGKFETKHELKKLLAAYDLDEDYADELLNENIGYVEIFGEDIDTIQVENGNELWIVYQDITVLAAYIDGGLYVDDKNNFLLVFADGINTYSNRYAIDLKSSTVGIVTFNDDNTIEYKWKYTLNSDDVEMLLDTIDNIGAQELGVEQVNIIRNDLDKLSYPVL